MRYRLKLERLAELLAASRLSQNHWALKLGLSRGHWSDVVNGRHPYPSAKTRERLLEVFGSTLDELFGAEAEGGEPELDFRQAIASRYEITAELGQGGMGTVYLANDRALGRLVAIKVVSSEAASGVGADQLLQEIAHVSRLQHPNILPLFEAGARAGSPFYVMPYIRDGSLGAALRAQQRLPLARVVTLVSALARALEHAHARQVLHCDIKPENILLQDDHPFLMDFGIARKLHAEASEWIGVRKELDYSAGTPAYVSPEQAAGNRDLDQRSDIYSLACVVYEMLTGRAPFEGSSTQDVVSQRFRVPPPPLRTFAPDVPASVAAVIERGMAIEPDRRQPTATAFAAELHAAAANASSFATTLAIASTRALNRLRAGLGGRGPARLAFPMAGTMNDLRYVSRAMQRNWRFALGVILTLGLGVGLGIPVLSIADHLFLRPPPGVANPDRVVKLVTRARTTDGRLVFNDGLTGLDFAAMTAGATALDGVAGWMNLQLSLGRGEDARAVQATLASASFFNVLGVRPLVGRFYAASDDVEGSTSAPCVVSYRFWKTTLGGRPGALGTPLLIGSVQYVVVGVAPEGFNGIGLNAIDVWLPLHVSAPEFQGHDPELWTTDRSSWLRMIGRLKPGVSVVVATADANRVYRNAGPRTRKPGIDNPMLWDPLQPGRSSQPNASARIALWLSAGGLLLLLLIAANLVNLFLARSVANARQVAVRLAIGGGRRQLFRLYLLESLVLGTCAAVLGLAISVPAVQAARSLVLPGVVWLRPAVDLRIGALALAIALGIGALVAVWTSWHAGRLDPGDLLRNAGTAQMAGTRRSHNARRVLLVAQSAMMAVLLCGATSFVLSLRRATAVDVGFDIDGVMAASIPLSSATTPSAQALAIYRRAYEVMGALPDVASVSLGYMEPWVNNRDEDISVPGSTIKPPWTLFDVATPEYLTTFGARMREGRWIAATDVVGTPPVVVINESLASVFWPGASALGHCLRIGADSMPCRTIVGVVRDFRVTGGVDGPMQPVYYLPLAQASAFRGVPHLFFRTRGNATTAIANVRRALQGLEANLPLVDVHPVKRNIQWLVTPLQLGSAVFTAFGALAMLVAAVGLYSVLSFLVIEQRRSHAIRVALGAPASRIVAPVVRHAMITVSTGLALGFAAAAALSLRAKALLFHTSLDEPFVIGAVALLGVVIGLLAASLPVRRVLRTDAMLVLRDQ